MPVTTQVLIQIAIGSGLIVLCAMIHILTAEKAINYFRRHRPFARLTERRSHLMAIATLFLIFMFSHTVQVYIWAIALWLIGALPGYEAPIYFAIVTYTTVGYGDITLSPDHRILGAMASFCGVMMIGLTTAVLVAVIARILNAERSDKQERDNR